MKFRTGEIRPTKEFVYRYSIDGQETIYRGVIFSQRVPVLDSLHDKTIYLYAYWLQDEGPGDVIEAHGIEFDYTEQRAMDKAEANLRYIHEVNYGIFKLVWELTAEPPDAEPGA